jgi:membrane-bound serine protease (ClpP class)
MDTYGGQVDMADSIRTRIIRSKIPVYVLIDNNAASAGALISIACDSIYMKPGSTIGAATVVDQSGNVVPDKYQSYMRSKMRATAERRGRNPEIAEAMVDPDKYIPGIIDSGKVLTFTTSEAIKHGFAEGEFNSIEEVLAFQGITNYQIKKYTPTFIDKIIGWLINPAVSGILIMIILGGIYFELQSPGIGFPIIASAIAATVFFAPYYIEGLAEHWEILLFIAGIALLAVEVFVIPGFGVAGIAGIALLISGLVLAMIENVYFDFEGVPTERVFTALLTVVVSVTVAVVGGLLVSPMLFDKGLLSKFVLQSNQNKSEGYSSSNLNNLALVGQIGIASTDLRPSGKIRINNEMFDAIAITGFIEKGSEVIVESIESIQLKVSKKMD